MDFEFLSKVLFKTLLRCQNRHEIQKTKYGKYLLPFSNKKKPCYMSANIVNISRPNGHG